MAKIKHVQNNLNGGELSPLCHGRTDIERYYDSVITMKNFLPIVQGGTTRRAGWHFIDYPKYNNKRARLIPFEYGVTQAYVVEVGDLYMRFLMDGYLIRQLTGSDLITNGTFTTDLTGWTDYSVSPGSATWNSGHADLDGGAGGVGSIGQALTTVSGKTYLMTFDVGTNPFHVRIGTTAEGSEIIYDVQYSTGTSKQISFIARGATTYIQFLRKSNGISTLDNVVCKEYTPVEIASPYLEADLPLLKWAQDANNLFIVHPNYQMRILTRSSSTSWSLTEAEFEDGPYFEQVVSSTITPSAATGDITMVASHDLWYSGHIGALWRLGWFDTSTPPILQWGYVKITSVEDTKNCHATVKKTLPETGATDAHREGRWSTLRGFPNSITFHENRLISGGADASPQTFWGAKSEEWDNHTPGTNDNDPLQFTIGCGNVNLIHWLASARTLIIGTPGGEFKVSGGNDNPITPSNIDVKNESTNGCANISPLRIGNAVLYIQRAGQQLLEMKYNFDSDSYEADDLTIFSDHLTKDGIIEIVYQRGYNPLVWAIKSNGDLLALTYHQLHKVRGWSQQPTNGVIESLAVIPNPAERVDDVYGLIKRTINGAEKRFIEFLDPYLNVDSGLNLNSSIAVSVISGLEHLIGEIVDIVGDGAVHPQQVIDSDGQIILDPPALNIEIGKHYDSYLELLEPEIKGMVTLSSAKRWVTIFAKLFETVGLKINGEIVPFRKSIDPMDEGLTPFTGDKSIVNLGWEEKGKIIMEQNLPLPATILCVFGNLEIND